MGEPGIPENQAEAPSMNRSLLSTEGRNWIQSNEDTLLEHGALAGHCSIILDTEWVHFNLDFVLVWGLKWLWSP